MKIEQKQYSFLKEAVFKIQLKNGMKVTLVPMNAFQETVGMITVGVGSIQTKLLDSKQEREFPAGIAHFLEHKEFEMSDGVDAMQVFAELEAETNAFTNFTQTSYYFQTRDHQEACLELLVELLSDTNFTESSISKEKEIIRQEILMYEDDPDARLYQEVVSMLYPGTPLATDIAGTVESIQQIDKQILDFYHQVFYQTTNQHLILVGQIHTDVVLAFLEKIDSTVKGIDSSVNLFSLDHFPVIQKRVRKFELSYPKLGMGFRGEIKLQEDPFRLDLLLSLFFQLCLGNLSNQFDAWYQEQLIDTSFTVQVEVSSYFNFLTIMADTADPGLLSSQLVNYLSHLSKDDLTFSEEQYQLVKNELYADFIRSLNHMEEFATRYGVGGSSSYDYLDLPDLLDRIQLDEVVTVGLAFLENASRVECQFLPVE